MFGPRMWYLTALAAGVIYYFASGQWLAWILLLMLLCLPWVSLVLSLPAILGFRMSPTGLDGLEQGEEAEVWLLGSCRWPLPPFKGKLRIERLFTGEQWRYDPEKGLPTEHCGALRASLIRGQVCDYLGIFSFPAKSGGDKTICIRPRPLSLPEMPDLQRYIAGSWHPKPGGGFSENHELRLYRPGDNLNQVHWKLSAKVGKLILREPMEPRRGRLLLTMTLGGTPEELDRKFGRLLWIGRFLLSRRLAFEIRVLTRDGVMNLPVAGRRELDRAVDDLLRQMPVTGGSIRDIAFAAGWQYHIGGQADET